MFLPIGDSPNPPGTPWLTYTLIAANVLIYLFLFPLGLQPADVDDPAFRQYVSVLASERGLSVQQLRQFVAQATAYDVFTFRHGFKPAAPAVTDVFSSMFLHGGLLHLLGNMLFLWIYGDNVEHRLGRFRFLLAYLGTGVAAAAGDALLRMGSAIPSVGASGAISGVLGFYFLWFPHNRVRVWIFLFPFFADMIEMPARVVLGFYVVFQNVLPLLFSAGGGVSYGAHLGGFVAGVGVGFLLDALSQARPERDVRRSGRVVDMRSATASSGGPSAPPPAIAAEPVEVFREELDRGRWDRAAEWFFGQPHSRTRHAVGAFEKIRLGQALAAHAHPHAALAVFQRALADHPRGPGRPEAHVGAARVLMGPLGNPTGAYQHLYAALEEAPSPGTAAEARRLLTDLAGRMRSLPRRLPD